MDNRPEKDRTAGREPTERAREERHGVAVPVERDDVDSAGSDTAREPVPDIVHEPEPDARNIIPAKDQPGTL